MVEKRYDEAKEKAMAEVQDAEYVNLTADMWTSINMDSYLGREAVGAALANLNSASKLIPIVRMIQHKVSEKTKLMTQESSRQLGIHLQQELYARCSGIETVRVLAMAALLDPRFNASLMKDAEKNLTAECASLIRSSTDRQQTTQGTDEITETLILWRGTNMGLFTGKRNAAVKGFE
ncbi:hypothetical protein SKAU_G00133110 [Synaphobranchus kaupii]|uniref:Uncharacterized protein n=1 Tax=Synaphobranchus kaupii TaxID=118154 RepID=A0A9Q1FQT0_SYNKA|nr:hypothetical protein SKAU_G00133110 [Synaphobranchus kaupii]